MPSSRETTTFGRILAIVLVLVVVWGAWWLTRGHTSSNQRPEGETYSLDGSRTQALALSSSASVTVAWDPNTEPDISGYKLYYWSSPTPTPTVIPISGTMATVATLSPGLTYGFRVTAVNTAGFESLPSSTVNYTVPVPIATPSPSPIGISGTVLVCSNPFAGVTLILTGGASRLSDGAGAYSFSPLTSGANYTVTPSKAPLLPGNAQINTVDVVVVQRHFVGIPIPPGCRLQAADVNGDGRIDTVDAIAIQRFVIGALTGTGNTGKYQFVPLSRTYSPLLVDQSAQNYDTILMGDTAP